jgi:hypothetical protein
MKLCRYALQHLRNIVDIAHIVKVGLTFIEKSFGLGAGAQLRVVGNERLSREH